MRRIVLAFILGTGVAHAHGIKVAVPDNPAWKDECGSCHLPYPPQFLAAPEWRRLMAGLDKHFGENAVLDPALNRQLTDFLEKNAGSGAKYSAPSLRISDTPWFKRVHDEVPGRAWTDPAVRSAANCGACHVDAGRGDWSERNVRMPAGLEEEEDDDD